MEYSDWRIRVVWQLYDNVRGVVFIRMTPLLMVAQFISIVQMSIWILNWSSTSLIFDDCNHRLIRYIFHHDPCLFCLCNIGWSTRCQYIIREYSIWYCCYRATLEAAACMQVKVVKGSCLAFFSKRFLPGILADIIELHHWIHII